MPSIDGKSPWNGSSLGSLEFSPPAALTDRSATLAKLDVNASICDVSSRAEREKLMEKVSSLFHGKLNVLINNAGTNLFKTALEFKEEDYGFLMSMNLESAFHLSQLAHPLLKASGVGRIVFISSVGGLVGFPEGTVYDSTCNGGGQWWRPKATIGGRRLAARATRFRNRCKFVVFAFTGKALAMIVLDDIHIVLDDPVKIETLIRATKLRGSD
ncbi:hypothetical protein IEQ34_016858 [Dendrobium chrysotoxum]|uniref:Uncharacterized protein n=1 Tax=Dendrobium chrysotoxum TaxID=161865 RepID=A0AAV7FZB7_DENCH|nr:hypothetical protein IEQ34_016858 [Dendrobium chrysotoxum]